MIVNARVAADPAVIEEQVRQTMDEVSSLDRYGKAEVRDDAELPPRPAAADAPLCRGEVRLKTRIRRERL